MIGVLFPKDSETEANLGPSVYLDVLCDDRYEDPTSSIHVSYSVKNNGRRFNGWHTGYYGTREEIKADLASYKALGITVKDLPSQIDVSASIKNIVACFREGKFEPPAFVLPEKKNLIERSREIYNRLRKPKPSSAIVLK